MGTSEQIRRGARPWRDVASLLAGYWAFGQFWGTFVVILTDLERAHGLSDGRMGLLLAALSGVSILTMALVTPRLQSLALSVTLPLALLWMGLGAYLISLPSIPVLTAGFLVLGVGNGFTDVFFNVAAQGVESRTRRPTLQFLHAAYSVGGVTGALGAGLAINAGVTYRAALTTVALIFVAAAAWSFRSRAVRETPRSAPSEHAMSLSALRRWPALVLPAVVVLFAFLAEGSMDVWSGAYLRRTLETTALAAGVAFAAFSLSMAVGRLSVAGLLFRFGYRRTVLSSGLGAFAAGVAAASTSSPLIAGLAFLFLGCSISAAAPAAFGMVGSLAGDPALAVSAMTTVGYTGFVIGPPLMGLLAQTSDLRVSMGVIVLSTLGMTVGGLLSRSETAEEATPTG